jgi:hypothetical protein
MMALVPPLGWGDVATRRDLELFEARIDARFERADARFVVIEHRLHAMDKVMATKQDIAELRSGLLRTIVPWIFASHATIVAAVGVLFTVLR